MANLLFYNILQKVGKGFYLFLWKWIGESFWMEASQMQKRSLILLLSLLLIVGAASDRYTHKEQHELPERITVTAPFNPQYTSNQEPQSSVDTIATLCGITQFSKNYHTSGAKQKVALIDSGIDLSHSAFQKNQNQSEKVAVYRDFTQEGLLHTQAVSCYGDRVAAGGTIYHIGDIANKAQQYRMAFLELGDVQPQLFPKGEQKMAVLLTATEQAYNCVYIDTNQNCDFSDEKPLFYFQEKPQYITLHSSGYNLNFALTSVAKDGSQIQLTADTLGHGTFLAGLIAANSSDYQGLAPQAQLCIYKIFNREGQSSQLLLAKAIRQAVLDDVDIINLSLSIPKDETVSAQLTEALNQAQAANIPVVAAAGNYGPGKNTIAYPARASMVIGVGSYVAPEMYALDKAVMLEKTFVADYSGRGKLNGDGCPLLVAPAGILSTVPGWYAESYLYDYGTSISSAIVAAAIAHIQEAATEQELSLSIEQLKNLLASWARDLNFGPAEQGYGALNLGNLPKQADKILQRAGLKEETTVYTVDDSLSWKFSVPQGQAYSWYVQVPEGAKELTVDLQIDQQKPNNEQEHLVALGRCQLSLYNPDGQLIDQTPYLGASYSREIITSGTVGKKRPQQGTWEIVITSADNLSQYNHFATTGNLQTTLR